MNDRRVTNDVPEKPTPVEADSFQSQPSKKPEIVRPSRNSGDAAPLSYAQQRLWLIDHIDPGKPLANMPRAFRIRGWLDVEALRRALDTIRERHEVLRSVFRSIDGSLVQIVVASAVDSLPIVDLSSHAEPVRRRKCCASPRRKHRRRSI